MTEETTDTGDLITDTAAEATPAEGATDQAPAETNENTADLLSGDESGGSEGVPETYTFEPPEGLELDEDTKGKIEAFSETAREMGLSQAQYQALIEYDFNRAQQMNEEAVEGWNQRVESWKQSARTDKEIGGEQFAAKVKAAQEIVDKFGDADLKAMLKSPSPDNPDGLALGNHPAMLRLLNRVAGALAEPELIQGEAAPETEGTLRRLYPSMFDKTA